MKYIYKLKFTIINLECLLLENIDFLFLAKHSDLFKIFIAFIRRISVAMGLLIKEK